MNHNELDMLLMKLTKIQTNLGGSKDPLIRDQNQDEFNNIKYKLVETINEVSKKQEERDENFNKNGRTMAVIKFGIDIQDGFQDLDTQLKQMKEALRRQKKNSKKFPPEEIEIREGQYQKYQDLVHQLKAREDGDTVVEKEKPITLTELKINLGGARRAQPVDVGRQLNDIEQEAINQFKKVDKEIDIMIDQVNVGLDNLKNKAEIMGDALEQQEDAIAGLEKEVDKANEQLMSSNAKLKKVLYTYKKPGSFCMNIICILVLLGLIGVIIKLATGL